MLTEFRNLKELLQYFDDERICRAYLEAKRWKGNVTCLYCDHNKVYKYANDITYKCSGCKKKFRVTTGTIFEKSHIPLTSWFAAIYLYTSHKTGVSAQQISRHLGITYQSAWYLHHRIMEAFKEDLEAKQPEPGQWEVDEVYIGPLKNRLSHARRKKIKSGTGGIHSTPIIGFYHRGKGLFGTILPIAADQQVIHPLLKKFIDPMSTLMTDGSHLYRNLDNYFLSHEIFVHTNGEYARGEVHSNTIEGCFRHFKDAIRGTYKQLVPKYMQRYWDEFCFKYNSRSLTDIERFDLIFDTVNRRITCKKLIDAYEKT